MGLNCKRCKKPIEKGAHCIECREIILYEKIEKHKNKRIAKIRNTPEYGIGKVKAVAEGRCWCSTHNGCFRASFGGGESEAHRRKKFERWEHHMSLGRAVFCELILKDGSRPDLIVVENGFVFIEEIVCSEHEASIILKKKKYPFPVNVIKV